MTLAQYLGLVAVILTSFGLGFIVALLWHDVKALRAALAAERNSPKAHADVDNEPRRARG